MMNDIWAKMAMLTKIIYNKANLGIIITEKTTIAFMA